MSIELELSDFNVVSSINIDQLIEDNIDLQLDNIEQLPVQFDLQIDIATSSIQLSNLNSSRNPKQHIEALEKDIVNYLNRLWHGIYVNKQNRIFNYLTNCYYRFMNRFTINDIANKLKNMRKVAFILYNGKIFSNEEQIDNDNLNPTLEQAKDFLFGCNLTKKKIMEKIAFCHICYKYKSGDVSNPANFRYFIKHHNTIKILDYIWYELVIYYANGNLPDKRIFILRLFKENTNPHLNYTTNNTIDYANNNTLSKENVVLLDLQKAYDSLDWNILEDLLYDSLRRKMSAIHTNELVNIYMTIITNRIIKYNDNIITVTKSIPTGLSTSPLVFTLIMEEIINQWLLDYNFTIEVDFIINIFIDDFYIKILNISKKDIILSSLISYLTKYKLIINYEKSRVDKALYSCFSIYNNFKQLNNDDLYLGIPFTRDITLYTNIILKELFKKHGLLYTWSDIYAILISVEHPDKSLLQGYLNYKLKPLLYTTNCEFIIDFIQNNLI